MGTNTDSDFASLLDDLFVAHAVVEEAPPKPTIPFDYLSVADELYSGRIKVAAEAAASEYREASESLEADFAELLASLDELVTAGAEPAEELPSVEPEAIARELNLSAVKASAEFSRLRRTFAFNNHPDRVAPHLRQRAMVRMQVANMLIDDAKRRAAKAAKR